MTLRIEPGPTDDDNRWPCCTHCLDAPDQCAGHDEPCFNCHSTPPPATGFDLDYEAQRLRRIASDLEPRGLPGRIAARDLRCAADALQRLKELP